MDRRTFLKAAVATTLSPAVGCQGAEDPPFDPRLFPRPGDARVAVLRAQSYEAPLARLVLDGLRLLAPPVRGRRVVLKPNLVEFDPDGAINTHPALIGATVEALLTLDAAEVVVAEGPGHRRDNEYILTASGLLDVLRERRVRYVDLNFDTVRAVPLATRFTDLGELYLPETVLGADLLVSMPKLKTHHWAGVTLSMKNLFGIVPGCIYGWPKNALHWAGIQPSILDINSTLRMPRFAIVDAIVGMEGNGPIQGQARPVGALVFGDDLAAVDATCARLMRIDPHRVPYLAWAGEFLGPIAAELIEQRGEPASDLEQDFRVLPEFESLKA